VEITILNGEKIGAHRKRLKYPGDVFVKPLEQTQNHGVEKL